MLYKRNVLQPGQRVQGKWGKRTYYILKKIGDGAHGEVYLVSFQEKYFALKISPLATSIALEYQILRDVSQKVQGISLGPFAVEMDDTMEGFYYVMEYVEGIGIESFLQKRGSLWTGALIMQVLSFLSIIHQHKVAFGDIKLENLLVHPETGRLRMVDFGGVTPFGKGVTQYTEWYDRAHWGKGSRRAGVHYDLFAVGMLLLRLLLPGIEKIRLPSDDPGLRWQKLMEQAKQKHEIFLWLPVLEKAWNGEYKEAAMMHKDVGAIQIRLMQKGDSLKRTAPLYTGKGKFLFPWEKRDPSDWVLLTALIFTLSVIVQIFIFH